MQVLIRLSPVGLAAQSAATLEARKHMHRSDNEYLHELQITPEHQSVADRLALEEGRNLDFRFSATIRLGNLVPSTITREPLLFPIAYDAPPTDDEIWQQLTIMAQQRDELINPNGLAY